MNENHGNSKTGFFFPHTAGNVTFGVAMTPGQPAIGRKAIGTQSLLRRAEADRRDIVRYDP